MVTRALTLLLHIPQLATELTFTAPDEASSDIQQLHRIITICRQQQRLSHTGGLLALFDGNLKQRLTELASVELLLSEQQAKQELQHCLNRITQSAPDNQLERLIQRAREQPLTLEEKNVYKNYYKNPKSLSMLSVRQKLDSSYLMMYTSARFVPRVICMDKTQQKMD